LAAVTLLATYSEIFYRGRKYSSHVGGAQCYSHPAAVRLKWAVSRFESLMAAAS